MRLKLILAVLFLSSVASAQNLQRFQNWCQLGGQRVSMAAIFSAGYVQASYPKCQVDVYLTGTSTHATIYSNNNIVPTPLSNPFNAGTDGSFGLYFAPTTCYDITISPGLSHPAMPGNYTFSYYCPGAGGGGGGGGTVSAFSADCSQANTLISCNVVNPTTTPQLQLSTLQFGPHKFFGNNTNITGTPAAVSILVPDLPITLSGTSLQVLTVGTLSGTSQPLCTDASTGTNATTSGCPNSLVQSVFGRTGVVVAQSGDYNVSQVTGAAPLASPAFTGVPTGPTAGFGTNTTQLATTAFVQAAIPASSVSSVFGRTGVVTAQTGDYTVFQVTGAAPLNSLP